MKRWIFLVSLLTVAPSWAMSMTGMYGPFAMSREGSGTSWVPESSPHEGLHLMLGDWMVMTHGYINAALDQQGDRRGATEGLSESMLMVMAQRPLGPGTLGLRSMASLDPLMGKSGYPLLLQTGETANGRTPLIDRQHPHDLFMELAGSYAINTGPRSSVFFYGGLPGEPALGPSAFMHRVSGVDNPEAPITHHWLDSTHVVFGVITGGWTWGPVKAEASGFRGREPDSSRWNIESPRLDSWSARFTVNPTENWSMQVSRGALHSPEQLEPDDNVVRWTASLMHNAALAGGDNVQTTLAWGENQHEHGAPEDALLLESAWRFRRRNTLFGRIENVDNGEIAASAGLSSTVNVSKATVGYIREVAFLRWGSVGVGATGTADILPHALETAYGSTTPLSTMLFIRAKIAPSDE